MAKAVYIHGTDASEQRRLVVLNRLTNDEFLRFLDVGPETRALEIGSGLGILASGVAAAAPGARVVGLERSAQQIAASRRAPHVALVQGDAHALPFADAAFDLAYARFVLEHVGEPGAVLVELARVLRPGGRLAVMENDMTLLRFDPQCPTFDGVWTRFLTLQDELGGDGRIGRRLFRLVRAAGFRDIELSIQPEVHWSGSRGWTAWVENIIGNVDSARSTLLDRGLCTTGELDGAVAELRALSVRPDASSVFAWNRVRARKPAPGDISVQETRAR
jgi:SAM-dependent methyltransferase